LSTKVFSRREQLPSCSSPALLVLDLRRVEIHPGLVGFLRFGSEHAVNSDLLLFLVKVAGLPGGWTVPTAGWLIILSACHKKKEKETTKQFVVSFLGAGENPAWQMLVRGLTPRPL